MHKIEKDPLIMHIRLHYGSVSQIYRMKSCILPSMVMNISYFCNNFVTITWYKKTILKPKKEDPDL